MSYGLQVFDASGALTFDSTVAAGGVALGFVTPVSGTLSFSYPDFIGYTGVVLNATGGVPALLVTVDNAVGYLRFTFDALCIGGTYALFAV